MEEIHSYRGVLCFLKAWLANYGRSSVVPNIIRRFAVYRNYSFKQHRKLKCLLELQLLTCGLMHSVLLK